MGNYLTGSVMKCGLWLMINYEKLGLTLVIAQKIGPSSPREKQPVLLIQ